RPAPPLFPYTTLFRSTCPSDVKQPAGTECADDGNPCTADTCNGTSNSCQHPAGNAGADCAADGDPCTTDTCDGTSTSCQHLPGKDRKSTRMNSSHVSI